MANSKSAKPSPFPIRLPNRSTATDPMTTRSILILEAIGTGLDFLSMPSLDANFLIVSLDLQEKDFLIYIL